MKFFNLISMASIAGTALLATSCANESPWYSNDSSTGRIELNLETDRYVTIGTRSEDDMAILPDKSDFTISLVSSDGSYDKTWSSISRFNSEEGFPMGKYLLSAYYGDAEAEGFEKPYYYGEEEIEVLVGNTTVQTITASLANSMVSVRYTDDLTSMYREYSAAVQTEGHEIFPFVKEETRPAYLTSNQAKFFVTLTNDKNETVTVNPVNFLLSPKHHYIVTVGVNKDNLGNSVLDVNVTEEIVTEPPLEIVLSDEFFSAPVPVITAIDFEPSGSFDFFEALPENMGSPKIQVMALAGLQTAKLKLTASGQNSLPVWNTNQEEIELVSAQSIDKNKLEQANIKCHGFFDNAAEFAFIDFEQYIKNLLPGSYTASLSVTDKLGRTVDVSLPEIVLKANVSEVKYEISGIKVPELFDEQIILAVSTNCNKVADSFSFEANNQDNELVSVKANKIASNPGINVTTNYSNTFFYSLETGIINDNQWTVIAKYAEKTDMKVLDIKLPEFTVQTDAFAKYVKVLITAQNEELTKKIAEIINVKNGDSLIRSENIDRTGADSGLIIVKNLNSKGQTVNGSSFDGNYNLNLYIGSKVARNDYNGTPFSFITEEARDVPNGDFGEIDENRVVSVDPIQIGSPYAVRVLVGTNYTTESSILRNVPKQWATINDYTCYSASTNNNTWYKVPSTFVDNGVLTIRSVGFHHSGKTLAASTGNGLGNGQGNTHYYGETVPAESDLNIRSGECFLGTYSYSGTENYNRGISFNSRPSSLSFNYSYMAYNEDDKGIAIVKFYGEGNSLLKEETIKLESTQEWALNSNNLPFVNTPSTNKKLNFDYEFGKKLEKIEIEFRSSEGAISNIYIPTGSILDEGLTSFGDDNYRDGKNKKRAANSYHAFAMKSELKISNVHFSYE